MSGSPIPMLTLAVCVNNPTENKMARPLVSPAMGGKPKEGAKGGRYTVDLLGGGGVAWDLRWVGVVKTFGYGTLCMCMYA